MILPPVSKNNKDLNKTINKSLFLRYELMYMGNNRDENKRSLSLEEALSKSEDYLRANLLYTPIHLRITERLMGISHLFSK